MKPFMTILIIIVFSSVASCSKKNDAPQQQVRFRHYLTGKPLPGVKVVIYEWVTGPLGPYPHIRETKVTDQHGEFSYSATVESRFESESDTLKGPLHNQWTGLQGEIIQGVLVSELYPVTKLHFTNTAGNYMSASISAGWSDSTKLFTVGPTDGVSISPVIISVAEITLVTHRPNRVYVNVTLADGTTKAYDQIITPPDFTPITLNIPY
jgi:hypothetical protein